MMWLGRGQRGLGTLSQIANKAAPWRLSGTRESRRVPPMIHRLRMEIVPVDESLNGRGGALGKSPVEPLPSLGLALAMSFSTRLFDWP